MPRDQDAVRRFLHPKLAAPRRNLPRLHRLLPQPLRPIWRQRAVRRPRHRILRNPRRRREEPRHEIHFPPPRRRDNPKAIHQSQNIEIRLERPYIVFRRIHHEVEVFHRQNLQRLRPQPFNQPRVRIHPLRRQTREIQAQTISLPRHRHLSRPRVKRDALSRRT